MTAQEYGEHRRSYRSDRWTQPFCKLYHCNLVDAFQCRCLLAAVNPLIALGQLVDLGYRVGDSGDAVELWGRAEICGACIDINLANPVVRRLRVELGVSA
jgi:hypothetical protein